MRQVLDLDRWPLDALGDTRGRELVARCRSELGETGMFSLETLVRPADFGAQFLDAAGHRRADFGDVVAAVRVQLADVARQLPALAARQATEDGANADQRCRQDEVGNQIRSHVSQHSRQGSRVSEASRPAARPVQNLPPPVNAPSSAYASTGGVASFHGSAGRKAAGSIGRRRGGGGRGSGGSPWRCRGLPPAAEGPSRRWRGCGGRGLPAWRSTRTRSGSRRGEDAGR